MLSKMAKSLIDHVASYTGVKRRQSPRSINLTKYYLEYVQLPTMVTITDQTMAVRYCLVGGKACGPLSLSPWYFTSAIE